MVNTSENKLKWKKEMGQQAFADYFFAGCENRNK